MGEKRGRLEMENIIETKDLTKIYNGKVKAVDKLNIQM